ncbi:GyrI-like domain-containing protein [Amycolatopsis pithecellobii]|uniref:AraC family transcriptional regulator n=1 Tax=Amycolatopsis pithecellobii TaxID=664692 RepID=A0A6N7Z0M9_9PSEU|nr:GyrI-like domain-containing protein [Amycolatopsis pithecellobii]MTD57842.1 AraC family transcriptional regulator [Amycolatopsis pithecellobii]
MSEPELVELAPVTTAVVRGVVRPAGLRNFFDTAFGALAHTLAAQGIEVRGPAFGLFRGIPGDTLDLEVGFTTAGEVRPEADVVAATLPGGPVARLVHAGSFDGLGTSWERLRDWIAAQGLTPGAERWECYVTRPTPDLDPHDLRTELNWPVTRR